MREIFVDTNVVLDLLLGIEPYAGYANDLFKYAIMNDIVLNICSFSYATVYYILRKRLSHENILSDLQWLSNTVKSLSVNENTIQKALASQFRDFEDAIQYFCALQIPNCEAIISRDRKGFRLSTIPVINPSDFLTKEI